MEQSQFYTGTQPLTLAVKKKILKEAYAASFFSVVDIQEGWQRKRIEMSFEEVMKKLTDKCHFYIVNRFNPPSENYLEIGFCTMGEKNDYFLWIHVQREMYLEHFIEKYKLKIL